MAVVTVRQGTFAMSLMLDPSYLSSLLLHSWTRIVILPPARINRRDWLNLPVESHLLIWEGGSTCYNKWRHGPHYYHSINLSLYHSIITLTPLLSPPYPAPLRPGVPRATGWCLHHGRCCRAHGSVWHVRKGRHVRTNHFYMFNIIPHKWRRVLARFLNFQFSNPSFKFDFQVMIQKERIAK